MYEPDQTKSDIELRHIWKNKIFSLFVENILILFLLIYTLTFFLNESLNNYLINLTSRFPNEYILKKKKVLCFKKKLNVVSYILLK